MQVEFEVHGPRGGEVKPVEMDAGAVIALRDLKKIKLRIDYGGGTSGIKTCEVSEVVLDASSGKAILRVTAHYE